MKKLYHILFLFVTVSRSLKVKPDFFKRNQWMCKSLQKQPSFDADLVMGKPWRIYYTWNMKLEDKCVDLVFKNTTSAVVKRVYNNMYMYLEQQPKWDSSVMYVSMSLTNHMLLLFPDRGPAGSFLAVPDVISGDNSPPPKNTVPLLRFVIRLLRFGKFLIMMDCHIGVGSLSARADQVIYRSEILAATAQVELEEGHAACIGGENNLEELTGKQKPRLK